MDSFNWFLAEMIFEQTLRQRRLPQRSQPLPPGERRENLSRAKRALASSLVRLGLRLDPAAREALGAFGLALAPPEARPQA